MLCCHTVLRLHSLVSNRGHICRHISMDINVELANSKSFAAPVSVYEKLHADGTPDTRPILQSDYDQVTDFIKKSFPKATRVQREIDQTLKRTFMLGKTELKNSSVNKGLYLKKASMNTKRSKRCKHKVPKRLLYEDFSGLNSMWKAYIADVLEGESQLQLKMNRLDFHGALIKVIESNCKDYEHLKGVVVKESKNIFVVVTESNITKSIPKRETVFDVELEEPKGVMRLTGNSLLTRPSERACKKMKSFMDFISPKLRYGDK